MGGWDWAFWIGGGVLGLAALVLGAWALLWDRSRGRRRCPRCWYDMGGVPGLTCPECGRAARNERRLFRARRRWRWVSLAAMLALLAVGTAATPSLSREHWLEWAPDPVLSLLLWFNASRADRETTAFLTAEPWGVPTRSVDRMTRWDRLLLAYGMGRRFAQDPRRITQHWPEEPSLVILGILDEDAKPALPFLLRLLRSSDPEHRELAARGLGELALFPRVVVPALSRSLADDEREVCDAAAESLGRFGASAEPAIPLLLASVEAGRTSPRATVVAMEGIGEPGRRAVGTMIESFQSTRRETLEVLLFAEGDTVLSALRPITMCLDDGDPAVRQHAALVFARFRDKGHVALREAAVKLRTMATQDSDAEVRRASLRAASWLRPLDEALYSTMRAASEDGDPDVREMASQWLAVEERRRESAESVRGRMR